MEPPVEDPDLIPIQFWRDAGSWQREGFDLMCRGLVIADGGQEIPATLLVIEEGAYMRAIDRDTYDNSTPVHWVT